MSEPISPELALVSPELRERGIAELPPVELDAFLVGPRVQPPPVSAPAVAAPAAVAAAAPPATPETPVPLESLVAFEAPLVPIAHLRPRNPLRDVIAAVAQYVTLPALALVVALILTLALTSIADAVRP